MPFEMLRKQLAKCRLISYNKINKCQKSGRSRIMLNAIKNRRSIRKYQNRPVERQRSAQVLQAGMFAPSSKHRPPWRFIVASGAAKAW